MCSLKITSYLALAFVLTLVCKNKSCMSTTIKNHPCIEEIDNTLGVITIDSIYGYGDEIYIYDKNLKKIDTLSIDEEYESIFFECLSKNNKYYKIKYNNGFAYLSRLDKKIKLKRWNDFILFSLISFDPTYNPIKKEKSQSSVNIKYNSNEFYRVIAIEGFWAKIDWGDVDNRN